MSAASSATSSAVGTPTMRPVGVPHALPVLGKGAGKVSTYKSLDALSSEQNSPEPSVASHPSGAATASPASTATTIHSTSTVDGTPADIKKVATPPPNHQSNGSMSAPTAAPASVAPSASPTPAPAGSAGVTIQACIPVFRIFDLVKAKEFYLGFLGMKIDWQDEKDDSGAPVYLQLSRGSFVLHLTEHFGDATPGSTAFIPMSGVVEFQKDLLAKQYRHAKPGLTEEGYGKQVQVKDPFGNTLRFCERNSK